MKNLNPHDIKLSDKELVEFAKDHTDFVDGTLDIISRGKIPKCSHKTVFENMCIAHGFTSIEWPETQGNLFYVKLDKLERLKELFKKAINNNNKNGTTEIDNA